MRTVRGRASLVARVAAVALVASTFPAPRVSAQEPAAPLVVYQDLDEVTARIPNLKDKPFKTLIDACDGFLQSEVIIFRDVETGNEVWSLSREECMDMAHTGRRPAWSTNGQYISFRGNQVFWNLENNQLWKRTWAGYTYVASADGSRKRPLWATVDGKLRKFNCDKYNMWDARRPNAWYCVAGGSLWRVTVDDSLTGSTAEAIFAFPSAGGKVIQEISDANFMLVEEGGANPNCYVVNLNRDPKHPHFCLSAPLKGAIHSGSFRFLRSRKVVTGGYEDRAKGGVILSFEDETELKPLAANPNAEVFPREGVEMAHLWHGPPDDRVGYFGKYQGKGGLWLQMPRQVPVLMGDVPDGHVTWCGRDPDWFFAAVGPGSTKDKQYERRLLAGSSDGKTLKVVCTPFDRRRPGAAGYSSIPLPTQSRDGNKCWFHSSMLLSTNEHTGSYIAVFRRPHPPTEVTAALDAAGAAVRWKPHVLSNEVKGYHVYRSDDGGRTFAEVTTRAEAGTEYRDAAGRAGSVYAVTAEEWSRLESDTATTSAKGSVTGWDRTSAAKPVGFKAELVDGLIRLSWQKSPDRDLRYYNVYASSAGEPRVEQKRLLVSPPHDETGYVDWTAPKGKPVFYALTVVDRQGNESAPARACAP